MNSIICPVCSNEITNTEFCEKCGWEIKLFPNNISDEMRRNEKKRFSIAHQNWNEWKSTQEALAKSKSQLNEALSFKPEALVLKQRLINAEKEVKQRLNEIKKLKVIQTELQEKINTSINLSNKEREELLTQLTEERKKNQQLLLNNKKSPLAFLVVISSGNNEVYCLYEGVNSFGSVSSTEHQHQIIATSEWSFRGKHFVIEITPRLKGHQYRLYKKEGDICLNSPSNPIDDINLSYSDIIIINELKLQFVNNSNKLKL